MIFSMALCRLLGLAALLTFSSLASAAPTPVENVDPIEQSISSQADLVMNDPFADPTPPPTSFEDIIEKEAQKLTVDLGQSGLDGWGTWGANVSHYLRSILRQARVIEDNKAKAQFFVRALTRIGKTYGTYPSEGPKTRDMIARGIFVYRELNKRISDKVINKWVSLAQFMKHYTRFLIDFEENIDRAYLLPYFQGDHLDADQADLQKLKVLGRQLLLLKKFASFKQGPIRGNYRTLRIAPRGTPRVLFTAAEYLTGWLAYDLAESWFGNDYAYEIEELVLLRDELKELNSGQLRIHPVYFLKSMFYRSSHVYNHIQALDIDDLSRGDLLPGEYGDDNISIRRLNNYGHHGLHWNDLIGRAGDYLYIAKEKSAKYWRDL